MDAFTTSRDKSRWDWTLMLMVPDWIDGARFATVVEQVGAKDAPARLDQVRLETLAEGRCVQTLHVASFDDETQVLHLLHPVFITDNGLRRIGTHHQISLSDLRRVALYKRHTITRPPFAPPTPRAHPATTTSTEQ